MAHQDVFFAGVPGAVRLHDCQGLLPALDAFFRLWPHAPQPAGLQTISGTLPSGLHETAPLLAITPQGRGYRLRSPWLPAPRYEPSRACLLCSLAIELVAACCHACPRLISLHAAAVCLHGRTLIFCGDNRAGKSTLVTRLMADAARGLGDDLLGLHQGKIFSFGVAPRLRLPLPSSPVLKRFMNERPGIRDRYYGYLTPSPDNLAPWGERHGPDAVILLERTPGSRAVLLPAPAATGMDNVLAHFLIPDGGAPEVLRLGSQLLDTLPCRILRYDDLDEAAELLAQQAPLLPPAALLPADFPPVTDSSVSYARLAARRPPSAEAAGDAGDSRTLWQQRPGLSCRQAGQSIFLTDSHGNHIFRLDGTGAVIWQLLSAPLSRDEALSLLAETFPDVPQTRIRHELKRLFQALFEARLIEKAHKSP